MKQAVLTAVKTFEVRDVPVPEVASNQALMRVHAAGVCGSDIHAYYGEHPFMSFPIVMGHEAAGEIVKVGSDVTNVKEGDRVVMRPQKICGECVHCKNNRYNICKKLEVLGCQDTGAYSEYYAVDASLLYKLPDNISYAEGSAIEPLAVGVHAVKRGTADIKGKKVLVMGAGTIGNVVAQSAKGMGAGKVMIADISQFKLDLATKCGIDVAVNTKETDLAQKILEEFGPDGVDVVYECTASEQALNQLLDIIEKGTTIVIVGVYGHPVKVNMANVQDREYSLVGTLMYIHEDYVDAIELVASGKVDLNTIITNHYPLTEVAEAYHYIDTHKDDVQKVILDI